VSAAAPEPTGGWQRLHPLSPLLRGGIVLIAILGYAGSQLFDQVLSSVGLGTVFPGEEELPDGVDSNGPIEEAIRHPVLALAFVVALLAVVALVNWVSWRFSRFRVGGGQVELRQGVLFRQHRQVRLERVQAVELSRPLLARALGLARVVVQSAGGSDSTLTLSYLELRRAEDLREHLMTLAGRSDEVAAPGGPAGERVGERAGEPAEGTLGAPGATPGALHATPPGLLPAPPFLEVPNGRLFVATILHGSTIVLGLLVLLAAGSIGVAQFGVVGFAGFPVIIPVAIGVGAGRVKELLTHGNFRLADTGGGVRLQEGLTDLRARTIPMHRIQALELVQPLWWRPFGWWRIRVNVAGSRTSGEGDDGETTLLPVGTLEEALLVLSVVRPDAGEEPWREGALGEGVPPGWRPVSRRARALDPLSWRRNAWVVGASAVFLRSGRLTRRAVGVPHARVQSLSLTQGWLQARLGMATAHVVPAPGPVHPVIEHVELADAEGLLDEVARRARAARRPGPGIPSLAPDPQGLVDWTRHPQDAIDDERQ
jgi:putative membrane protein